MWLEHGAWVLGLALLLEQLWGDPKSAWHPVATLGNFIQQIEQLLWKNSKITGVFAWFLVFFAVLSIFATLWYHIAWGNTYLSVVFQALLLWFALGWKSLIQHTQAVAQATSIEEARQQVSMMVGRDTANMDDETVRKAAIESLAENTSDAVIAPLFWFALLGAWGAWAYRIINTMDAMWGHKNDRYIRFGWFAAKVDDAANFVPARITAYLMLLQKPRLLNKLPTIYAQAREHPSPNAGFPETAMAFLLGICLGGAVMRAHGEEQRPHMGIQHQSVTRQHVQQAIRISNRSVVMMLGIMLGITLAGSLL